MTTDGVTAEVVAALTKRVEGLEQQVRQAQDAVNELLAREFRAFLDAQGIAGEPVGAEELQKRMAQPDLEPNEFSRGIIKMREE